MNKIPDRKRRFLITGAAGFVGSNLIYKLEKIKNVEVIAVVHKISDSWRLKEISSKIKVVECDLTKYDQVEALINKYKPGYIIHLATKGIYANQWANPSNVLITNYSMNVNILEASYKCRHFLKGFVMAGSIFEYGSKSGSMKEEDESDNSLANLYAVSKRSTSILANYYSEVLPIITLRLSTAYGPWNDPSKFIEGIIYKILERIPIEVAKGVIKDFIYIEDVADALILGALSAKDHKGETINIGSGEGNKLEDVLGIITRKLKDESKNISIEINEKFRRNNETKNWGNIDKADRLLNWKPKYNLEKGLDLTIEWYRKNRQLLSKTTG